MSTDLQALGRTIRAEVIGAERSEAALAGASDFDRPFQELALKYCWGEIWGRPDLDRRTRSIVNLAALAAMGKLSSLILRPFGYKSGHEDDETHSEAEIRLLQSNKQVSPTR